MFVDASAIIAVLAREEDAALFAERIGRSHQSFTSPIALYEAVLGLARCRNLSIPQSQAIIDEFLTTARIDIVPVTGGIAQAAIAAFSRFGKGRHVAGLNMGDCFAYACARELEVPLLFKGNDFPQTDIAVA